MKNPVFDAITRAIDAHALIVITDEAGARCIEPYLIFESASGDMLLHGWQRSGAFRTTPPPRFCNLHLDDIIVAEGTKERFAKAHPEYNPRSQQFHRVIYELDRDVAPVITRPKGERGVTKPRRRPPSRTSGDSSSRLGRG